MPCGLKFASGPSTIKQAKLDAIWLLLKKTKNNDPKDYKYLGRS